MTGRGRGGASTGASPWPGSYKALASIQHKRDPQCQNIYFKKEKKKGGKKIKGEKEKAFPRHFRILRQY